MIRLGTGTGTGTGTGVGGSSHSRDDIVIRLAMAGGGVESVLDSPLEVVVAHPSHSHISHTCIVLLHPMTLLHMSMMDSLYSKHHKNIDRTSK
jgi:hypothetical protein